MPTQRIRNKDLLPLSVKTWNIEDLSVTNAKIADATITNAKIGSLSADKITTGTLVAKDGTTAAKIVTRDVNDNDIVVLDTSGITVNSGKMTIKDSSNTTIIDATGLVGAESFTTNGVLITSTFTTTSTTEVDITSVTMTTASYSRSIPTLVLYTAMVKVDGGGDIQGNGKIRLNIDGSTPADAVSIQRYAHRSGSDESGTHWVTLTNHWLNELGTGTHTIKMRAIMDNVTVGTPELTVYFSKLTSVTLGT